MFIRLTSLILISLLIFEPFIQYANAQVTGQIDFTRYISSSRNTIAAIEKYRPLHLRYLEYLQDNNFKLLLDKGDFLKEVDSRIPACRQAGQSVNSKKDSPLPTPDSELNQEINKLMEYFFIGLSLPNESFWVNLRPDSPDNIIDSQLAKTDIGKILLEADVQLKKDTALYTLPQTKEGKAYWDKLYKKAEELYDYDNITIPTLTRPWIVPQEIIIRETPNNAYIYKATLKVMLEEDYLSGDGGQDSGNRRQKIVGEGLASSHNQNTNKSYEFKDPCSKELNTYSTQLIKELIIPKLTKEINTSRRYAKLRQVYYSLILAQWFKARFHSQITETREQKTEKSVGTGRDLSDNSYKDIINSNNLTGLTSKQGWSKETYYKEYQKSFKDGEYNLKLPARTPLGQTIRSYFSGGIKLVDIVSSGIKIEGNPKIDFSSMVTKKQHFFVETINNNLVGITSSSVYNGETLDSIIPQDAYNIYNEIEEELIGLSLRPNSFIRRQMLSIKEERIDSFSLPRYTNFLKNLWKRIITQLGNGKIKYNKMTIVYNPLGGFDPYVPFTLVEDAVDVFSVGLDGFGSKEDILNFIKELKTTRYNTGDLEKIFNYFSGFDYMDKNKILNGLKGIALIRIIYLLESSIEGVYYFKINKNGNFNFLDERETKDRDNCKNAVIVFKDKQGNLKRYWYIQHNFYANDLGFRNFIGKLQFQVLLIKAALDVWRQGSYLRDKAIKKVLIPAKNNHAVVISDAADNFKRINGQIKPHAIWMIPPFNIQLSGRESFGYSTGRNSDYIYFGDGEWLIGEEVITVPSFNVSSSPVSGDKELEHILYASDKKEIKNIGGVDFHALPIVTQSRSISQFISPLDRLLVPIEKLDEEWCQIEKMVNAGIIPSGQRIKEYLISSCLNRDSYEEIEKVSGCVVEVLRLEEENLIPIDKDLQELLVLLESEGLCVK
ncbi:MAG: hypothetical protein ABIH18_00010 [Candidatus Omnitrophota bacterium]